MRILAFILIITVHTAAKAVTITGKIGTFPIEMEISNVNWETGAVQGKYRYASKNDFLQLKGEILQNIVFMVEYYEDEVTGSFYLAFNEDGFSGRWISGKKWYDVQLNTTKEIEDAFSTKAISDYTEAVNSDISGGYADENYFINDMWFQKDNPQLEIGFNGGTLVLEEISEDSLRFRVEAICGPTYHFAYASAIAHRVSENSYTCLLEVYEGDTCRINIEVGEKSAHVMATGNYSCGFGARAYLDHDFAKITNQFKFDAESISIEMLKGQQ